MEEDLLTLGVDTATERRSVVLSRGGRVLSASESELREGGSANLLADIDRVLKASSVALGEVGLFAAAVGPGSFTGLRSGLATVKGLALITGKPVVGVPTLHAVAYAARPARRVVALIPAGRGEVFAQLLAVSEGGRVTELEEPAHLPPARLVERVARLEGGARWAGGGALKYRDLISRAAGAAGISFTADLTGGRPDEGAWVLKEDGGALALSVSALARSMYAAGWGRDAGALGAIYVRPSDAEMSEQCRAQR